MYDKFSDSYSSDILSGILKFGQNDDISRNILRHKDCPHAAKLLWVKDVIKGLLKNKKWCEIRKFIQESNVKDLFNDVVKNDFLMSLVQRKISEILSSHESEFKKYIENIPKQETFVTLPHFPNDFKYDKYYEKYYEQINEILSIPKNVKNECCDVPYQNFAYCGVQSGVQKKHLHVNNNAGCGFTQDKSYLVANEQGETEVVSGHELDDYLMQHKGSNIVGIPI